MHRLFIAGVLLLSTTFARAGDIKYPVFSIPEKLLKTANAVKRVEEIEVTINSLDEMIVHRHYAITILNENGASEAALVAYYDKLNQVRSIEGALYDAMGIQIKKLKNKDIIDESATGSDLI